MSKAVLVCVHKCMYVNIFFALDKFFSFSWHFDTAAIPK